MWQDGLKVLKFHSCLRLLAPSYIVTSGLVGLLLLLEWEIQVERSLQMKILKHQNKSGICLGRAGFFT